MLNYSDLMPNNIYSNNGVYFVENNTVISLILDKK